MYALIHVFSINIKDMIILNLSNARMFQLIPINSIILHNKKITCEQNKLKILMCLLKITIKYPLEIISITSFNFKRVVLEMSNYGYICYLHNLRSLILSTSIISKFKIYTR